MKQRPPTCELCGGYAALFCEPDAALLCWQCDASVHGANFLVARHIRRVACLACHSLDDAPRVSGAAPRWVSPVCISCVDPDTSPSSPSHSAASSSSSSSLSTSESGAAPRAEKNPAKRRRRPRVEVDERIEGVLLGWSRRMGLRSGRQCAEAGARAIGVCEGVAAALPLRVALAAALWFAIKLCEDGTPEARGGGEAIRRLEACSGVPARLIMAAESRIARVAERVRVAEEGWAECP